ncbi:programmed cell death protein 5, partial [Phenoliferia sp. Uapishka_3]
MCPTVSRIALVRPERAKSIEALLMRMAQGGQLRGQVSEDQLIGVLDQVEAAERGGKGGKQESKAGKIVFSRKQRLDDSDDDFDL